MTGTNYEFNPQNLSEDEIMGIYQFLGANALDDGWNAHTVNHPKSRHDLVTNRFGDLGFVLCHTATVDPKKPSSPERHRDYLRVSYFGSTLYEAVEVDHKPTDLIFPHFTLINNAIVARNS